MVQGVAGEVDETATAPVEKAIVGGAATSPTNVAHLVMRPLARASHGKKVGMGISTIREVGGLVSEDIEMLAEIDAACIGCGIIGEASMYADTKNTATAQVTIGFLWSPSIDVDATDIPKAKVETEGVENDLVLSFT